MIGFKKKALVSGNNVLLLKKYYNSLSLSILVLMQNHLNPTKAEFQDLSWLFFL